MTRRRSFVVALLTVSLTILSAVTKPVALLAQAPNAATAAQAKAKSGDEPLPDLVVDQNVVAQQQEDFKAACEEDARRQVSIDCPCMLQRYPEFRLKQLSRAIRQTQTERDAKCGAKPPMLDCQQVQDRLAKLMSREGQTQFNPIGRPGPPGRKPKVYTSLFYVDYLPQCKNSAALAQQIETDCLAGPPPAGKNAADYCSCVAGHYRKGFEAAEGAFSSNLDVSLKTEAYVACRK